MLPRTSPDSLDKHHCTNNIRLCCLLSVFRILHAIQDRQLRNYLNGWRFQHRILINTWKRENTWIPKKIWVLFHAISKRLEDWSSTREAKIKNRRQKDWKSSFKLMGDLYLGIPSIVHIHGETSKLLCRVDNNRILDDCNVPCLSLGGPITKTQCIY